MNKSVDTLDTKSENVAENDALWGKKLSFPAAEAYKLLRTNLFFSLQNKDDGEGQIIAVTSSTRGEGKSTTCINTSYTLAESGKKVILVECDMRLPVLAKNIGIKERTGLSNYIVGMCSFEEAITPSTIHSNLDVVLAGNIPPNPSELLGSERFSDFIKKLAQSYDYVMIDLPPITCVSDALVVARVIDGMVIVVRRDVCTQVTLRETMRQLSVVSDKILGFIFNGAQFEMLKYGKKYGKKYG